MSLQIINRRGYLHEWKNAELQSPPKGNLRRGEIAIAIVTDDGTENGDIVEVIGRIGPSDTPTPFSDCPVVFRSPRGFKGENVRPVLVEDEPQVDSVLAYDATNNKFVSLDEDPGTYEDDQGGTEGGGTGGGGTEGGGGELSEVAPTILFGQIQGLGGENIEGVARPYTISVEIAGRPDPVLHVEIIETEYPDSSNPFNNTSTTRYAFSSSSLPQGVTLVTSTDSAISQGFGTTNYLFSGLEVLRASPMNLLDVKARVYGDNPAGTSPTSEFAASIRFVDDPATAVTDPTLTKVSISEGGNERSKIANLATDGTVTLTANYVASDFTDGVANGTVSYQWSANGAALVGETSSTLTLTNTGDIYNDSQIKVDVTISDDNGTDTRSGYLVVGDYDEGFTEVVPSADSRLIYIATDGDDAQATSNQHGRPYYLPSDPEIGPDPMNPVGPIRAYADPFLAAKYVRGAQYSGDRADGFPDYDRDLPRTNGYPDWIMFRRGQSFDVLKDYIRPSTGAVQQITWGHYLGSVNLDYPTAFGHGASPIYTGGPRGRSESEPMVVTAWGPIADPRPVLNDEIVVRGSHIRFLSFELPGVTFGNVGEVSNIAIDGEMTGLLFEDCKFTKGLGGGNRVVYKDARVRRCVVVDNFNPSGHNQGLFVAAPGYRPKSKEIGWDLIIEECVFDRNGYKEDPNEPTTWTNGRNQTEVRPYGQGVQPKRTYFDRNLYLSSYSSVKVRGNIISRGGGGSDVQMRSGGVCERNLFLMNHKGVLMGGAQDSPPHHDDGLVIDNVFLHDEHFTPPGGYTNAVQTDWYTRDLIIKDNVVARYALSAGTAGVLNPAGKQYYNDGQPEAVARFIGVVDNEFDIDGGKYALRLQNKTGTDILDLAFAGNAIWKGSQLDSNPNFNSEWALSGFFDPSGNTSDEPWEWSNNDYGSSTPGADFRLPNGNVDFAGWQAAGFDVGSTVHPDRAAFEAAAGWTDPDRSILTYMQAVDPTYTVDEDVYVDDGSSGQKQAVRQKVWEQLVPDFSEADAKSIARNYHAFLAFIEKARNNRKGAWDSRWTAEAVNNYIREGYGKPALGGPYTADLSDVPALVAEVNS